MSESFNAVMSQPSSSAERKAGGRPPKYEEPSRPVTVTLPKSTLEILNSIDPDRGKAIVKLARAAVTSEGGESHTVEVVDMAKGVGVIVVGPSAALRRIPFLRLIEVAPARYLLALEPGHDFRALELALIDASADIANGELRERHLIERLLEAVREVRRTDSGRSAEILLVTKKSGPKN